ncbi:hypothetical protein [Oceanithermus profundus]
MRVFLPWVQAAARPGVFFVFGAVTVVFLAVFTAVLVPAIELASGAPPPDVVLLQTPADFFAWLRAGGAEVRRLYGLFLVADTFYPVVYALFLGAWLWRLDPGGRLWPLPIWAAAADYVENLAHALLLYAYPAEPAALAGVALVATPVKWGLIALALLAVLGRTLARRR